MFARSVSTTDHSQKIYRVHSPTRSGKCELLQLQCFECQRLNVQCISRPLSSRIECEMIFQQPEALFELLFNSIVKQRSRPGAKVPSKTMEGRKFPDGGFQPRILVIRDLATLRGARIKIRWCVGPQGRALCLLRLISLFLGSPAYKQQHKVSLLSPRVDCYKPRNYYELGWFI